MIETRFDEFVFGGWSEDRQTLFHLGNFTIMHFSFGNEGIGVKLFRKRYQLNVGNFKLQARLRGVE